MSTLVTYFSHTGRTAALAHALALRLGAEEEPILEVERRAGVLALIGGGLGALLGRARAIRPPVHDPAGHDLVLLGTPVWGGRAAPAVNAWIDRHWAGPNRVAFFCTEGGRGHEAAFARMARRLGRAPAACLAVTEAEIADGAFDDKIAAFLSDLGPGR